MRKLDESAGVINPSERENVRVRLAEGPQEKSAVLIGLGIAWVVSSVAVIISVMRAPDEETLWPRFGTATRRRNNKKRRDGGSDFVGKA